MALAWCTIAHLGGLGKLAVGLSIAARIARVRKICIQSQTVIPKSVHNSSQHWHPHAAGTNLNSNSTASGTEWHGAGLLTCIDSSRLERRSPRGSP
eukprot:831434-Rhodomonas_salina.1